MKKIFDLDGNEHELRFGMILRDTVTDIEGVVVEIHEHIAGCTHVALNYCFVEKDGRKDYKNTTVSIERLIFVSDGNPQLHEIYQANKPNHQFQLGNKMKSIVNGQEGYVSLIGTSFSGHQDVLIIKPTKDRADLQNGDFWSGFEELMFIDDEKTAVINEQKAKRERNELELSIGDHVVNLLTGATGIVTDLTELTGGTILACYQQQCVENKKTPTLSADIELLQKL